MTANLKALVQKLRGVANGLRGLYGSILPDPDTSEWAAEWLEECATEIERMESEPLERARTAETPETGALKACPFCGGKARFVKAVPYAMIQCQNKQCEATNGLAHTRDQAAECWNRRTP